MLDAPIIQSEGRAYPVERHYLDATTAQPSKKELTAYIHRRILRCLEKEEGNILVFLAGVRQIKEIEKLLNENKLKDVYISTLYGNLSKEAQDRAIKAPPTRYEKSRVKYQHRTNFSHHRRHQDSHRLWLTKCLCL